MGNNQRLAFTLDGENNNTIHYIVIKKVGITLFQVGNDPD